MARLTAAADQGLLVAWSALGDACLRPRLSTHHRHRGAKLIELAAANGAPDARLRLAEILAAGDIVEAEADGFDAEGCAAEPEPGVPGDAHLAEGGWASEWRIDAAEAETGAELCTHAHPEQCGWTPNAPRESGPGAPAWCTTCQGCAANAKAHDCAWSHAWSWCLHDVGIEGGQRAQGASATPPATPPRTTPPATMPPATKDNTPCDDFGAEDDAELGTGGPAPAPEQPAVLPTELAEAPQTAVRQDSTPTRAPTTERERVSARSRRRLATSPPPVYDADAAKRPPCKSAAQPVAHDKGPRNGAAVARVLINK